MAGGAATRSFHKELYVSEAIDDAVAAYADFATLSVAADDQAWTVGFADIDEDYEPEMLASEFANFVLAATIDRTR
jgi:hypothetical protein